MSVMRQILFLLLVVLAAGCSSVPTVTFSDPDAGCDASTADCVTPDAGDTER